MTSTRQEKVNSVLQRLISEYLVAEKPEGITGLLTVTAVNVSADLEHAKVYFSSLGQDAAAVRKILTDNIYDIQGMLYQSLTMKKVPRIVFIPDSSGEHAGRITKVLKELGHGD